MGLWPCGLWVRAGVGGRSAQGGVGTSGRGAAAWVLRWVGRDPGHGSSGRQRLPSLPRVLPRAFLAPRGAPHLGRRVLLALWSRKRALKGRETSLRPETGAPSTPGRVLVLSPGTPSTGPTPCDTRPTSGCFSKSLLKTQELNFSSWTKKGLCLDTRLSSLPENMSSHLFSWSHVQNSTFSALENAASEILTKGARNGCRLSINTKQCPKETPRLFQNRSFGAAERICLPRGVCGPPSGCGMKPWCHTFVPEPPENTRSQRGPVIDEVLIPKSPCGSRISLLVACKPPPIPGVRRESLLSLSGRRGSEELPCYEE